ncbi:MAG: SAM-dependent methyltransferase [Microthrixaceae bacterium]
MAGGAAGYGSGDPGVHRALRDQIARSGSIRFDEYMDLALYAPDEGFFATGGGAGRGGSDFLTSPEVGPLFGELVAEYLDRRWESLGCPDPFVVVEAGAGRGALALSVIGASPRCRSALRYVLVERSDALRARHGEHLPIGDAAQVLAPLRSDDDPWSSAPARGAGPLVCSLADLPGVAGGPLDGVVIANELLDNIAFRLAERRDGAWHELRVTRAGDQIVELFVPMDPAAAGAIDRLVPAALPGMRVPLQVGATDWLRSALGLLQRGSVVAIDYTSSTTELARRPIWDWLRTYRHHERGLGPLVAPGAQDITVEVAVDQLAQIAVPTRRSSQADWLRRHGLDAMVEEGRRVWNEHAARPGLVAMRARSRVNEAAALTDPNGLGGFEVLEWDLG